MEDIGPWLTALGLEHYLETFRRHEIDLPGLTLLSEADLERIGVSLGARRKILSALASAIRPPPLAGPNLRVAERRHLTVLFCDMVGSTEYADRLDPEDFRRLVETFLHNCSEVVRRQRGLVASYIGDAVKSYFGYPVADEDDAERAVLAGLEMLEAVAVIATARGERLRARLGVASGEVVIGSFTAPAGVSTASFGHVAHLAARLQTLAAPNTLLADAATYQAANGAIEFIDFGRHSLKGFSDPVQVWEARHIRPVGSRFAKRVRLTRLCGRDAELAALVERWSQVSLKDGGQAVFISGEAGIGKSRLLNELQRRLRSSKQLAMQCVPAFESSTLYPFLTELKRRAGIADGDDVQENLTKLRSALSVSDIPLETSIPIFANLLSISAIEAKAAVSTVGAERQRAVTKQVFKEWIAQEARSAPLLVLFEDEQWADRTSRDLLDTLLDGLASLAVLILVSSRNERDASAAGSPRVQQLKLSPLNSEEASALIHDLNPAAPPSSKLVDFVLHRAEGVPLYIEELTASVLESGLPTDAGLHSRRLAGGDIPSSLQSSLLARLDRLGPAKEIAQTAATIGREFDLDLLEEATGHGRADLRTQLAHLIRSGLIVEIDKAADRPQFQFKHALLQQAAEGTILRERRQQLHALVANALEKRDPTAASAYPELLAQHFANAALHDRAAEYWLLAGLKAGKTWAKVEAAGMFARGIEAATSLPDSEIRSRLLLRLELERGDVLYATFGYLTEEASSAYHRALELSEKLGDPEAPIRALDGLFGTHFNSGQFSDAIGAAHRLIDIGKNRKNIKALVLGLQFKGMSLFCQGELESAQRHLVRALEYKSRADEVGSDFPSMSMIYLSWTVHILGCHREALALLQEAELIVRAQSPYRLAAWLGDGCILFAMREDSQKVIQLTQELIPLARENGFKFWTNYGNFFRGWTLATTAGSATGTSLMRDTVDGLKDQEVDKSCYLALLAQAYLQTGQIDEATETVSRGLEQADKIGEHYYTAELIRLSGELGLREGDAGAAEASFRQAIAFARQQTARSWELKATRSLCGLLRATGRRDEADRELRPIADWFLSHGQGLNESEGTTA